ncbi:MAG TPA: hypothetical protein VF682_18360 [Pseudomonas sp.]|jgi:hypothetical protein
MTSPIFVVDVRQESDPTKLNWHHNSFGFFQVLPDVMALLMAAIIEVQLYESKYLKERLIFH